DVYKRQAYGVIDPEREVSKGLFNVKKFVEKPAVADAPSDLAIIGRYLLTPETCLLYTSPSPRDPKTSRMP
ncbi:hypothetical protein GYK49_14410, partial [Lactobacillus paracasei]